MRLNLVAFDLASYFRFYLISDAGAGENCLYLTDGRKPYNLLTLGLKLNSSVTPFIFGEKYLVVLFSTRAGHLYFGFAVFDIHANSIDELLSPESFFVSDIDLVYHQDLEFRVKKRRQGRNAVITLAGNPETPLFELDTTPTYNPYGGVSYRILGWKGVVSLRPEKEPEPEPEPEPAPARPLGSQGDCTKITSPHHDL